MFTGDAKGNFLVLDSGTGKLLLRTALGGALAGGMVTYRIEGRQYVAFTTGNISRSTNEMAGTPTLVIMGLPDAAHPINRQASEPAAPVTEVALKPGDALHGKALYLQTCAACHGADGTALSGHTLKDIRARMDRKQLAEWIRNPKAPMPRLFPSPLGLQDVEDIAAYAQGL